MNVCFDWVFRHMNELKYWNNGKKIVKKKIIAIITITFRVIYEWYYCFGPNKNNTHHIELWKQTVEKLIVMNNNTDIREWTFNVHTFCEFYVGRLPRISRTRTRTRFPIGCQNVKNGWGIQQQKSCTIRERPNQWQPEWFFWKLGRCASW